MNDAVFFLTCLRLQLYMIELKLIVNCLNVNIFSVFYVKLHEVEVRLLVRPNKQSEYAICGFGKLSMSVFALFVH